MELFSSPPSLSATPQQATGITEQPPKARRSGSRSWIGVLVLVGGLANGLAHGGSQRAYYLLGVAVGAVLISITFIVMSVRRTRSQRAANVSYAPPPAYRIRLVASTVLGAIGIIGIIVCTALVLNRSGPQPNYDNPSVVAASIKTQVQQRLSDQSSQYFEPGVTVTSVVCTPSGTSTDRCVVTLSNGVTFTSTAVILGNGAGYRTR